MIVRDAVVGDSKNFDHLGLFNLYRNLSTRTYSILGSIENAATAARIQSRDCGSTSGYLSP